MNFDRRITPLAPTWLPRTPREGRGRTIRCRNGQARHTRRTNPFTGIPPRMHPSTRRRSSAKLVDVFDERDGWAWAQLRDDGYVGYLPDYAWETGGRPSHRVSALRTFAYPGPNLKLPNEGLLSLNSRVTVSEIDGDYRAPCDRRIRDRGASQEPGPDASRLCTVAESSCTRPISGAARRASASIVRVSRKHPCSLLVFLPRATATCRSKRSALPRNPAGPWWLQPRRPRFLERARGDHAGRDPIIHATGHTMTVPDRTLGRRGGDGSAL